MSETPSVDAGVDVPGRMAMCVAALKWAGRGLWAGGGG